MFFFSDSSREGANKESRSLIVLIYLLSEVVYEE